MMNRSLHLVIVLIFAAPTLRSQVSHDTLSVMAYNLLFYGQTSSFCTTSNNPIADKDDYFKTVANYVRPDILVVNEMGANSIYLERILARVLNTGSSEKYARVPLQRNSFQNIANGVFYNQQKFGLVARDKVEKNPNGSDIVRVIDVVTLYYKDEYLEEGSDTVFLHVLGAHLKAGNSDEVARGWAAEATMEFIKDNYDDGYFMLAGDLNIYSSSEAAFQEFTDATHGAYRFLDPISTSGSWNNNGSFADVHTQSTHTSGSCFSGGGMDDRFDFILMSESMLQDTSAVSYVENSYDAVGQDGNRFNQSLIQGTNNSVPNNVLTALYNMSDHLPVVADIRIKRLPEPKDSSNSVFNLSSLSGFKAWLQSGELRIDNPYPGLEVDLIGLSGQEVARYTLEKGYQTLKPEVGSGVYFLKAENAKGMFVKKVLLTP